MPSFPDTYELVYSDSDQLKVLSKQIPLENGELTAEGNYYEIHTDGQVQPIKFQNGPPVDGKLNGATNEALIAVLLDRLGQQNSKFSCSENEVAIDCLKNALFVLESRTRARKERGVLGKDVA